RALERPLLPRARPRGAVEHPRGPVGVDVELEGGRALGAEVAAGDGASRVALDVDDLAVDRMDERPAADGAVGADARSRLRVLDAEAARLPLGRREVGPAADEAGERRPCDGSRGPAEQVPPREIHAMPPRRGLCGFYGRGRPRARCRTGGVRAG